MTDTTAHDSTLGLTAEIDRPLINGSGKSVRHLVVTVRAPHRKVEPGRQREPLNLGLVIDASGSMAGAPLAAAKAATVDVVHALEQRDHVSLVSFADDVVHHATAVAVSPAGKKSLDNALRSLVTRGSTDLCSGWLSGCEAVAGRQAVCDGIERNHVVLLSDGHANQGETDPVELARHAGELRKRGIITSTVGIGCDYSPTQLQAIAEAGGGRMHDAELPDEISRIVMAELTDTLATTVESLEVSLRLPANTKAELYGTAPVTQTADGCEVLVGSLIGGAMRRLAIKLTLPAGEDESTLEIGVAARWKSPGETEACSFEATPVKLRFASGDACSRQPRDGELARYVAEQWQAYIFHHAMVLNQDGQEKKAAAFVEREVKYLRRYCEGLEGMEQALETMHSYGETVACCFSPASSKEVMLRAYKMGRHEADHRGRADVDFAALVQLEKDQRAAAKHGNR